MYRPYKEFISTNLFNLQSTDPTHRSYTHKVIIMVFSTCTLLCTLGPSEPVYTSTLDH